MKNLLFLVSIFAFLSFSSLEGTAQTSISSSNVCKSGTVVATGCVGACGVPGELGYYVTPASQRAVPLCLQNLNSSLCPNTGAFALIYVDGSLVASGVITAVGSSIPFVAQAGSTVKVLVPTFSINNGIQCIWLGNLNFGLKR